MARQGWRNERTERMLLSTIGGQKRRKVDSPQPLDSNNRPRIATGQDIRDVYQELKSERLHRLDQTENKQDRSDCKYVPNKQQEKAVEYNISPSGRRRPRCNAPGCNATAKSPTLCCVSHGGGKRCKFEGCVKGAANGGTQHCKAHGGGKRCKFDDCTKSARQDGNTKYCFAHGGGRRCETVGCASAAVQTGANKNYCLRHGGGYKCAVDGCHLRTNRRMQKLCRTHFPRKDSGVCLIRIDQLGHDKSGGETREEQVEEALVPRANYEPSPPHRRSQKEEEHIRTRDGKLRRRCITEGCQKVAQAPTRHCISHGGGKRCLAEGCNTGAAAGGTQHCIAHGGGMRCLVDGCTIAARRGGTQHCVNHGGGYRCRTEGCNTGAAATGENKRHCLAHGGGNKCAEDNCNYRTNTELCRKHRAEAQAKGAFKHLNEMTYCHPVETSKTKVTSDVVPLLNGDKKQSSPSGSGNRKNSSDAMIDKNITNTATSSPAMMEEERKSSSMASFRVEVEEDLEDGSEDEMTCNPNRAPGRTRELRKIRESRLQVAAQGFRYIQRHAKITTKPSNAEKTTTPFDPEEVRYKGRTFRKGLCYRYKRKKKRRKCIDICLGIRRFVSPKEAECVLIIPFEDTILGIEDQDVDYKADFRPASHFQVYGHVSILRLRYMDQPVDSIGSIPEWIYEPQCVGSWNRFGYFLDTTNGRITRKGRREQIRLLELFSGAGGMHLGFEQNGYTTVAAVDCDLHATTSMRNNCKGVPVYCDDIRQFLRRHQDPARRRSLGRIDHVIVTPPCRGFSGANRNGGVHDKANNDLSLTDLDAVRLFEPTSVTFENVIGMWRRKHVHYLKNIVKELLKLGYQVRVAEMRAHDFGSAQIRPRIIVSATHRSAPPPQQPNKTHGDDDDDTLLPFVSTKNVLSALEGGIDSLGNPLRNLGHAKTTLRPGEHGVQKLDPHRPAPAIRASSTPPIHYEHNRCISVRECAMLQDFPTTFKFYGSLSQQYRQVGNAVPVGLASKLARAAREVLDFEYEGGPGSQEQFNRVPTRLCSLQQQQNDTINGPRHSIRCFKCGETRRLLDCVNCHSDQKRETCTWDWKKWHRRRVAGRYHQTTRRK